MALNSIKEPDAIIVGTPLRLSEDEPTEGARSGGTYVVQPGETLSGIAADHGNQVEHLMRLNGIAEPDRIQAGMSLLLTDTPTAPPPSAATTPYVVQPGDTLLSIALRHRLGLDALMTANPLADPDLIQAGQLLVLPADARTGTVPGVLERARGPRSEGRYEEAASLLVEGLAGAGDGRGTVALAASQAFLAARNYGRAADLASVAAESEETTSDALVLWAQALVGLGRSDAALRKLEEHLGGPAPSAYTAFQAAELWGGIGDGPAERGTYERALQLGLSPMWSIAAERRIGESLAAAGEWQAAASWYERAARTASGLEDQPPPVWFDRDLVERTAETRTPELLLRAAEAQLRAGNVGLAAARFAELASIYPSSREALPALDKLQELGHSADIGEYSRGRVLLQALWRGESLR
jgi:LysM repeat protein